MTFYVAQSSAGADDGSSAANAKSIAWLNNAANWGGGAGEVMPGDTVRLVGTFTTALTLAGSGSSGNPVTILFETGAKFSTGCWPGTGAINLNSKSYLTIDGGEPNRVGGSTPVTGTLPSTNGKIENTSNGTGLATEQNSAGVFGNGTNIIIQNLTVTDIYKNIPGDANRFGYGIDVSGSVITITNCDVSDGDAPISYTGPTGGAYSSAQDIFITNNRILRFNHGINMGVGTQAAPPQNCALTNVVISGNLIDYSDAFDEDSGSHHLDGIILYTDTYDPTVTLTGLHIFGNTFGGNVGVHNTAAIFSAFQNALDQLSDVYIYNNIFLAPTVTWGNGFVALGGTNVWVFNNTFDSNGGGLGTIGGKVYNNLCIGVNGVTLMAFTDDAASGTHDSANDLAVVTNYFGDAYSDFNIFSEPVDPAFGLLLMSKTNDTLWVIGGGFHPLTSWQTWDNNSYGWTPPIWNSTHADPNSLTASPAFNSGTYVPSLSDTVANGAGINLTELGVGLTDYDGVARPAEGPWTIGAYEASAGGGGGVSNVTLSGNVRLSGNVLIL